MASLDPWKWCNCHGCQAACHGSDWQTHGDWSTKFYLINIHVLWSHLKFKFYVHHVHNYIIFEFHWDQNITKTHQSVHAIQWHKPVSILIKQLQKIAPRMHQNWPFWAQKWGKMSGRGHSPLTRLLPQWGGDTPFPTPHPLRCLDCCAYGARLDLRLWRSTFVLTAPRPQGRLPWVLLGPSNDPVTGCYEHAIRGRLAGATWHYEHAASPVDVIQTDAQLSIIAMPSWAPAHQLGRLIA